MLLGLMSLHMRYMYLNLLNCFFLNYSGLEQNSEVPFILFYFVMVAKFTLCTMNTVLDACSVKRNYCSSVFQEPVTFEDVAIDFTEEEWGQPNPAQKALYKEVMLEIYGNLILVGEENYPLENFCSLGCEKLWPLRVFN